MTPEDRIRAALFAAVDELNEQSPEGQRIEKSSDTVLFGSSGRLDSLGLVNLIVSTEERIEDEFGVAITIADERAISQENSPFRTLGTLSEYIGVLLQDEPGE